MARRSVTFEVAQAAAQPGFGSLESTMMNMLDQAVSAVRVETTFGPPIYIPQPFRREAKAAVSSSGESTSAPPPVPGQPSTVISGQGFDVARMLKPKISVEMNPGWGDGTVIAPYGDPGPSKYAWVVAGIFGIFILAAYGGVRLVRDVRRK